MTPKLSKKQEDLQTNANTELPTIERGFYWLSWISFFAYLIYRFILVSHRHRINLLQYLTIGSPAMQGLPADPSDYTYYEIADTIQDMLPLCIAHVILANIIKKLAPKILPIFYIVTGCLGTLELLGVGPLLLLVGTALTFYFSYRIFRSVWVLWICFFLFMVEPLLPEEMQLKAHASGGDFHVFFMSYIGHGWTICRSISFCSDYFLRPSSETYLPKDIMMFLSYVFYLPYLSLGPLVNYNDFENAVLAKYIGWSWKRFFITVFNGFRFLFLFYATDWWTHISYHGLLSQNFEIMKTLDSWEMWGFIYSYFHYYHMKLFLNFGLPSVLGSMEHMAVPDNMRCPATIGKASTIYVKMDTGLYKFLHKYIYLPIRFNNCIPFQFVSKYLGIFSVYITLILWHQPVASTMYWMASHLCGFFFEISISAIFTSQTYKSMQLSGNVTRRIRCLLLSPILMSARVAGIFFASKNEELGIFAFDQLANELFTRSVFVTCFFNYCLVQVSIDWDNYLMKKEVKDKTVKSQ